MPLLTGDEVLDLIGTNLPAIDQHGETVEIISDSEIAVRIPFDERYLGQDQWGDGGQVFSGPMMMGIADTAMYGCIHAVFGPNVIGVIISLNISFLEPARAADLVAHARVKRRGRRLAYLETELFSEGSKDPIAHVTATYRVRNRDTDA